MTTPAVRFAGIGKRFPGVAALDAVSFDVAAGECHAVCGENGAGKSTLSKILAGILKPDAGTVFLDGNAVEFWEPRDALAAGVAMVHQELVFCENLSVAENLFLGQLPSRAGWLARKQLHSSAEDLLASIGADIDPSHAVETLSVAQQQLVQIAAAVGSGARIIVLDEPTSSLGQREVQQLYTIIAQLKSRGVTLIYISHRMPEIFALCDTVTVLRDGRHVSTEAVAAVDEHAVVQKMIGRQLQQYFPAQERIVPGAEVLRIDGLTSRGKFHDVSLALHAGEVVGVAGLTGAGRSELAQAIFGLDRNSTGRITVRGTTTQMRSPRHAMQLGIGLVPEDRKHQGLVLEMLSRENITLPILDQLSSATFVRTRIERRVATESAARTQASPEVLERPSATLSGGNQQKIVLAKWVAAGSTILILDEPTRGIDVGAKAELHAWIDKLAAAGHAVLLISSELPELLNLSQRIVVMREGRVVGEVDGVSATQEGVVRLMTGVSR